MLTTSCCSPLPVVHHFLLLTCDSLELLRFSPRDGTRPAALNWTGTGEATVLCESKLRKIRDKEKKEKRAPGHQIPILVSLVRQCLCLADLTNGRPAANLSGSWLHYHLVSLLLHSHRIMIRVSISALCRNPLRTINCWHISEEIITISIIASYRKRMITSGKKKKKKESKNSPRPCSINQGKMEL